MNVFQKASAGVAGLALAFGGLTLVTTVEASAAAPCASENNFAGAASNDAAHKRNTYIKANKRFKKAKKAYRKHHTKANKKRLKKAKKARNVALNRYRASAARANEANARANSCQGYFSSPQPAQPADVVKSISNTLISLGVPPEAIAALQPLLGPLGEALKGTPLNQLGPIVDQIAAALQGAIPAPGGSTDPFKTLVDQLSSVIDQITAPLTQAGLPADQIANAIKNALAQIPTDPTQLQQYLTDPQGLIDLIVDGVQNALAGTPLDQLNPVLEQVQQGLDDVVGTLLGSLTGGLPTLPGL